MPGRSRYDNDMSTPQGASNAPVLQGSVIEPSQTISPKTAAARSLGNVLKTVITSSHVFRDEGEMLNALKSVEDFVRVHSDGDHSKAVREDDPAPREDVSLRKPPAGSVPAVPANVPQIDYAQLAAALVAAQRAQSEQDAKPEPEQVHTITDAQ